MKYNLISKDLFNFKFPFKASKMDNDKLSAFIINTYINFKFTSDNNYNDIIIKTPNQHIDWIENYIREKIGQIDNFIALDVINRLAQINGYLESSYKRNHINHYDYKRSPHYTSIYVVKGTGRIILEHPTYKQENNFSILEMKPGEIFVFNSDLNYFTDKNYDDTVNRQLLITNYEKL